MNTLNVSKDIETLVNLQEEQVEVISTLRTSHDLLTQEHRELRDQVIDLQSVITNMALVKPKKSWKVPEFISRTVLILLATVTYGLVAGHLEDRYNVDMPSIEQLRGD